MTESPAAFLGHDIPLRDCAPITGLPSSAEAKAMRLAHRAGRQFVARVFHLSAANRAQRLSETARRCGDPAAADVQRRKAVGRIQTAMALMPGASGEVRP